MLLCYWLQSDDLILAQHCQ